LFLWSTYTYDADASQLSSTFGSSIILFTVELSSVGVVACVVNWPSVNSISVKMTNSLLRYWGLQTSTYTNLWNIDRQTDRQTDGDLK